MKSQLDAANREAEERISSLKRQLEESEMRLKALQKQLDENLNKDGRNFSGSVNMNSYEAEIAALKEKIESRDVSLQMQQTLVANLKGELFNTRTELSDRKEEIKELRMYLFQKSDAVQDFISKELLERNKDVRDLQGKLYGLSLGSDKQAEVLKMFIEAKGFGDNNMEANNEIGSEGKPTKDPDVAVGIIQARSNSLSRLSDDSINTRNKDDDYSQSGSKAGRSSSFSLLENALYAHMGQKVYNTNQTFNTYVLPSDSDGKQNSDLPSTINNDNNTVLPKEALRRELLSSNNELNQCEGKELLTNILNKSQNTNFRLPPLSSAPLPSSSHKSTALNAKTARKETAHPTKIDAKALQAIYSEMSKFKEEIKALHEERKNLCQQVAMLKKMKPCSNKSDEETSALNLVLQKELQESRESTLLKDQLHGEIVSDFKEQIDALKEQLQGTKKRIVSKVLEVASIKYQESMQKFKQEIISLRKRLADSHDACHMLRNRLEELVEFFEQILEMEKCGKLSLGHLSSNRRVSLQQALDDSRALSHSLSHSLMIGMESLLEDNEMSALGTPFDLPLNELTEQIDLKKLDVTLDFLQQDHSMNASSDCHKDLIHSLLASEMDAKTEEIDTIIIKLNQLSNIVQMKDQRISEQMESIISLKQEMEGLQRELRYKDKILLHYQLEDNYCSRNLFNDPKQSNNYISPTLNIDDSKHPFDIHTLEKTSFLNDHDVAFHQESGHSSSGSSTALPPPPSTFFSSQEKPTKEKKIAISEVANVKDDAFPKTHCLTESPSKGTFLEHPPALHLVSPSESEAWSEPDRNVSLARIGLDTSLILMAGNHDRSSRSSRAATKSAPFTSESEGEEVHPEDNNHDGTLTNNKPKRRSDAAEVRRLMAKLRTSEQMNETLRAELHIYQMMSQQFSSSNSEKSKASSEQKPPETNDKNVAAFESEAESSSIRIPSSLFQEIRCLRRKLEEAITNNDLLRDQLEAALSGYLSEETKNLTGKLSSAQQEIKVNQEQIIAAAAVEQKLRLQLKETDGQVYELNERLSHYLSSGEQKDKKIQQLHKELKVSKDNCSTLEQKCNEHQMQLKNQEKNLDTQDLKMQLLVTEISTLKANLERSSELKKEKEALIEEQNGCIIKIETEIKDLNIKLVNLQQERGKRDCGKRIEELENGLQDSEEKRLKVSKENLSLIQEITKLKARLESCKEQSELLKFEVRERSATSSDDGDNIQRLNKKLQKSQLLIQDLHKEREILMEDKIAAQKEMKLLQEEVAALKSHLDHVLARENKHRNISKGFQQESINCANESFISVKSKISSVSTAETLENEVALLKEQLGKFNELENDLETSDRKMEELQTKNQELISQLDSERCLTKNLQLQNSSLQHKIKMINESKFCKVYF